MPRTLLLSLSPPYSIFTVWLYYYTLSSLPYPYARLEDLSLALSGVSVPSLGNPN